MIYVIVDQRTSRFGTTRYRASCSDGDYRSNWVLMPDHAEHAAVDHVVMKHKVERSRVRSMRR